MSSTTTVYNFEVTLSQIDRGVFETLNFHVAQHPSETMDYLLTRVLAYGIEFTKGIESSTPNRAIRFEEQGNKLIPSDRFRCNSHSRFNEQS